MANCPWQWVRGNFLISKKSRCLLRVACGKCHKHWCKSKSPRQPSRIHLEFPPWQLPRGSGIAASLQLQKVTLPIPRCRGQCHQHRCVVAGSLWQWHPCNFPFAKRTVVCSDSIKNPWKIHPGGSLGVPRPPQRGPGAILSSPEGSQSGPGPSPRPPRAPREAPRGPRGRPRDGP